MTITLTQNARKLNILKRKITTILCDTYHDLAIKEKHLFRFTEI